MPRWMRGRRAGASAPALFSWLAPPRGAPAAPWLERRWARLQIPGEPTGNPAGSGGGILNGPTVAPGRLHAPRGHPHRCLALSWRLAGRELQLRASAPSRAPAGGGEVRRLLHGGSSGRAGHAGGCAEAQPHRHLLRALHAAVRPGGRDGADRAGGDRLDHLRRALSHRPALRLPRPSQRRQGGVEHRHHRESGCGAEFRSGHADGARCAL